MQAFKAETPGFVTDTAGLQCLFDVLADEGYRVVGPTLRDDAIVYGDIDGVTDLPSGWTDRQAPGRYALERRQDNALFGYAVGPHSWKKFLFPPIETLWSAHRGADGAMSVTVPERPADKFAFVGVRSCEIHAMAVQDKVFGEGAYVDAAYAARRSDAFIVAVNCAEPGGTCFCVSMETGPRAAEGFDLALTELIDAGEPMFLVETGSEAGRRILEQVPHAAATAAQAEAAMTVSERAAAQMGRSLDTSGIKELLQSNPEHSRWDDVAARCLSCANCTMVCPTCFCSTVEDHSDLTGQNAERVRKWDSCFTMDFSYIHGGSVRASGSARYRQWMTHKLANWIDQFGTSGCVGCGRCVTWCPVGIDLTEEVAAIRAVPDEGRSR
ncbi:4Fe-4S dicluster domain-containing protein [Novosphingobium album (ex Hu et al. 2023)]|uniref:4Fe-4S dicluster domain-containing protein n=1 Tax=Novosphingobium album (ex Hu et al. 2023) TaxID=2930093 RepID=A0ABT0AYG2_9SPHN|nr:4Fe-4S dicluster domain-containing protein [Novosphingobium album (ex Hu et al. 2023)]MCJ2177816.1 4Fe-4S dicluster domain-containing protein [Novosphingobium album (ex Hu et al. 2023)]